MLAHLLDRAIHWFTTLFPEGTFFNLDFMVRGTLAVLLVSLVCGSVGSLVAGNRMAFFSDALAHCAFAGVAIGFLLALSAGVRTQGEFTRWVTPVMLIFGVIVGIGIAFVREQTNLASDTVIGIFFAGAVGFGAILFNIVTRRRYFSPETFLFGDPLQVQSEDLIELMILAVCTAGMLLWLYNDLVFTSFNTSLARSRQIRIRLCNYAFVVLLALIVNLCLKTVGVLLINAMLIVPAATAANVARNMRQLFWVTIGLCLFVGVAGQSLSWSLTVYLSHHGLGEEARLGVGGTMVVLSVMLFFLSMVWAGMRQRRLPTTEALPE